MSYPLAEHDRMIAGMIRKCRVVALDLAADPPVCRVSDGEWTSAWVRWHSLGAAPGARHWLAPGMHEQGVLISTSGDVSQGTFLPGLYGGAAPAPDDRDHVQRWLFEDGGSLTYDWQAKRYSIELPAGQVDIKVGGSVITVTESAIEAMAPMLRFIGPMLIQGALRVTGDIYGDGRIIDTAGNTPNHKH